MSICAVDEQIRLYAKQLKIPTFAEYEQVLRQADPNLGLSDLLLELMKTEYETRQQNQYRRRLKTAGFPYQKTLDEFDFSQLNDSVSPAFLPVCTEQTERRNDWKSRTRKDTSFCCLWIESLCHGLQSPV